ncbi:hypothetical protein GCM10027051_11600 [Niabella terrae]
MIAFFSFIIVRSFLFRKNNIPILQKARKNENAGLFHEAIQDYEKALIELKTTKFHHKLKSEIGNKIKLLHTVLNYNKNICFTR